MKFGVNTFIWSDRFDDRVESLLPAIRDGGFDEVKVPLFRASDFPAARIRKGTAASDLACTVCSVLTTGLSLISSDAEVRRNTRTSDEWKWAIERNQQMGPVPAAHQVTLAIEPLNRFETYFLNTAQDVGESPAHEEKR